MALPYFKDGVSVGNLPYPSWDEISGLARAQKAANLTCMWAIDDGLINPAQILALNMSNAANSGTWTLTSASGFDIEDMGSATITGQPYIYIGDIGDNGAVRSTVSIFRVKEPTIAPGTGGTLASGTDWEKIVCVYPTGGGNPVGDSGGIGRDAEAMFVDPSNGKIYILTKRRSIPQLFSLPHQATYSDIQQTLTFEGFLPALPVSTPYIGAAATGNITAADISPDGSEILVRSYSNVWLVSASGQTIPQALSGTFNDIPAYVGGGGTTFSRHPLMEPQGEAILYDNNGLNFYTASEAVAAGGSSATGYPLYRYDRISEVMSTLSLQDGSGGFTGVQDTYIWSVATGQSFERSNEPTFVADYTDGSTSERYGLIKFDLSAIPSNAIIVGCDLNLYVAVEGASFRIHKMYQSWVETSTYTSLGGLPLFNDIQAAAVEDVRYSGFATFTGALKTRIPVATIQNWVTGAVTNNGWVLYNDDIPGGNGFQFASSEAVTQAQRPNLVVRYYIPSYSPAASSQVQKVIYASAIKHGTIFTQGTAKFPMDQTIDSRALSTPSITSVEVKYSGRFDDVRYYSGDTAL